MVRVCVLLSKKIHEEARRIRNTEEVKEFFPGFKAYVDSTEQEMPRTKNVEKRKTQYGGQRKRHNVKTQLTASGERLIVHKGPHRGGGDTTWSSKGQRYQHLQEEVE